MACRQQRIDNNRWKKQGALLLVLLLLCAFCENAAVFAQPETEEVTEITVSLTIREYITNTVCVEKTEVTLWEGATLADLLANCREQELIADYAFADGQLDSIRFVDNTLLQKGSYGEESGFDLSTGKSKVTALEDYLLRDQMKYTLSYRMHREDSYAQLSNAASVKEESFVWTDSWDATMESACRWLYHNRTRGSVSAILALGFALHSANPTDITLLTQPNWLEDSSSQFCEVLSALVACGYDPRQVGGDDLLQLFENLQTPQRSDTLLLCQALQLYDSASFTVDESVKLSRRGIIEQLLARQQENGSFSEASVRDGGVYITAKALQVLSTYRDLEAVDQAIQKGIGYLSDPQIRDELFSKSTNCLTISAVVTALCCCEIPLYDISFSKQGVSYADLLLQYSCVSGGFSMTMGSGENEQATAAAVLAMQALKQQANPYTSAYTLVSLSENILKAPAALPADTTVEQTQDLTPADSTATVPEGFWKALGSVLLILLFEILRLLVRRKLKRSRFRDETSK